MASVPTRHCDGNGMIAHGIKCDRLQVCSAVEVGLVGVVCPNVDV